MEARLPNGTSGTRSRPAGLVNRRRGRAVKTRRLLEVASLALAVLMVAAGPASADTRVVGDSLSRQTYIEADGWYVNARNGRPLSSSGPLVAETARRRPRVLVVALGSNDVAHGSATMSADIAHAASRPVPCVVITTVKVTGVSGFYGPRWAEHARRWNRAVWASSAVVADWRAASAGHPGYFLRDGLHLTRAGESAYNALLRSTAAACST